jgi:hypothetical protein
VLQDTLLRKEFIEMPLAFVVRSRAIIFIAFLSLASSLYVSLQFRAEVFNVLNRANFNSPNAVVFTPSGVSPTAGLITNTSTTSRQIQLGLKLLW